MKKKRGVLVGVIVVIFLIYIVQNRANIINSIALCFEETPLEYKAYENLFTLSLDKNNNVKHIETSYVSHGKINGDSLIWLAKSFEKKEITESDTLTYYKINYKGIFIDSLFFIDESVTDVGTYIISIENDYFSTWLKDGDTIKKPFNILNNKQPLTEAETKANLKDADYLTYDYETDQETKQRYKKVFFLKNDKWSQFYTHNDAYLSGNMYYEDEEPLSFVDITETQPVSYYQKEKWRGRSFPNFSYNINGVTPDHWRGISYFDYKNADKTFSFKEQYAQLYAGDKVPRSKLSIYKNQYKNFIIINNGGYGNDDYSLFLVCF
ncbi:hypothetical protein H0I23_06300 [Cellulophaga sp. HaHaR_3_176]|uniref:hypothetical protein n=1 Tax=Cellulophaga sp. HaHaR_3_176 TaxID=1942464 RepID=UPI001C1F6281|nr:hypothetical protein [Cellulophaga sp. HaHaR_3_176]QWX85246.1 hypothetical protein H0I23_06300 [Cellulophaga sp. HaHaR_3_176]